MKFSIFLYLLSIISFSNFYGLKHDKVLEELPELNIHGLVTLSGQSSGAAMSVQLHISLSSYFNGVAIFAAAPYLCAKAKMYFLVKDCTMHHIPDLKSLISLTKVWSVLNVIDKIDNIINDNVYIFHGKRDTIVQTGVIDSTRKFYDRYIKTGNVFFDFDLDSQHGTPTVDFGEECTKLKEPYIGRCNFDGAGKGLKIIYGKESLSLGKYVPENLFEFSQIPYIEKNEKISSIASTGYIYVPTKCQSNKHACRLHVSLHGCFQSKEFIGNVYAAHSGYNNWAENSDIVVLYPYVKPMDLHNPSGCWDWWGYTGKDYIFRNGTQIKFIKNMIDDLIPNFLPRKFKHSPREYEI